MYSGKSQKNQIKGERERKEDTGKRNTRNHPHDETAATYSGFEKDSVLFIIVLPESAAADDEAEKKVEEKAEKKGGEEDRCEGSTSRW